MDNIVIIESASEISVLVEETPEITLTLAIGNQGVAGATGSTGPAGPAGVSRTIKTGVVSGASFSGNPKKYSVVFLTPYLSTAYTIDLAGTDSRSYTYESKLATGFVINTNANAAISGEVSWSTTVSGET